MTRRPGLDEVARLAGVSKSAVSRVLKRRAAREHWGAGGGAAVIQLDYTPNQAARSLAGHRANAIALVVSEPSAGCWRIRSSPG